MGLEPSGVTQHLNDTGHNINTANLKLMKGVTSPKELNAFEAIFYLIDVNVEKNVEKL